MPMIADIDYSMLPYRMQEVARAYVEDRHRPGDFLLAVLTNDLVGAFGHADAINAVAMAQWASWLYNEAPSTCWGSHDKVQRWLNP